MGLSMACVCLGRGGSIGSGEVPPREPCVRPHCPLPIPLFPNCFPMAFTTVNNRPNRPNNPLTPQSGPPPGPMHPCGGALVGNIAPQN